MSQRVKGFLASDGTFFETEAECQRHEFKQEIARLCDSHDINSDNFYEMIREWNAAIKGYYHADSRCKEQEAVARGKLEFFNDVELSQPEEHIEDVSVGDKDAPGFLEQQIRGRK